jgi:hypothetical protein
LCNINKYFLKDKDDNTYPLIHKNHITHILDSKNVDGIDTETLKKYVVLRYDFYDESDKEIKRLFNI